MGSQYYKRKALDALSGNWKREILMIVIYFAIVFFVEILTEESPILNVLATLATIPLGFGLTRHYLDMANGKEDTEVKDLFYYYTNNEFLALIAVEIVVGILGFLWSLLLIIPGIIKGLSYSQSIYIKMENEEIGVMDAISLSKEMMDGYKKELFFLGLSFIGWVILGVITIIGIVPVIAYISLAYAFFYVERRDDFNKEVIDQIRSCNQCGSEISDDSLYCEKCGNRIM